MHLIGAKALFIADPGDTVCRAEKLLTDFHPTQQYSHVVSTVATTKELKKSVALVWHNNRIFLLVPIEGVEAGSKK